MKNPYSSLFDHNYRKIFISIILFISILILSACGGGESPYKKMVTSESSSDSSSNTTDTTSDSSSGITDTISKDVTKTYAIGDKNEGGITVENPVKLAGKDSNGDGIPDRVNAILDSKFYDGLTPDGKPDNTEKSLASYMNSEAKFAFYLMSMPIHQLPKTKEEAKKLFNTGLGLQSYCDYSKISAIDAENYGRSIHNIIYNSSEQKNRLYEIHNLEGVFTSTEEVDARREACKKLP